MKSHIEELRLKTCWAENSVKFAIEVKYFMAEGNQTLSVSKNDFALTEKLCLSL